MPVHAPQVMRKKHDQYGALCWAYMAACAASGVSLIQRFVLGALPATDQECQSWMDT